jgi:haloacetate dehalogenase
MTIGTAGIRIRILRGGAGPPLLRLHGHPEKHVTWCKVAPCFAERYSVIAPDLDGDCASGTPPGGAGAHQLFHTSNAATCMAPPATPPIID